MNVVHIETYTGTVLVREKRRPFSFNGDELIVGHISVGEVSDLLERLAWDPRAMRAAPSVDDRAAGAEAIKTVFIPAAVAKVGPAMGRVGGPTEPTGGAGVPVADPEPDDNEVPPPEEASPERRRRQVIKKWAVAAGVSKEDAVAHWSRKRTTSIQEALDALLAEPGPSEETATPEPEPVEEGVPEPAESTPDPPETDPDPVAEEEESTPDELDPDGEASWPVTPPDSISKARRVRPMIEACMDELGLTEVADIAACLTSYAEGNVLLERVKDMPGRVERLVTVIRDERV